MVETNGLLNRRALTGLVSSNLTSSARIKYRPQRRLFYWAEDERVTNVTRGEIQK